MAEKVDQMDPDEKIVEIAIERLRVFENHPFRVEMDSQMKDLQDSIKKYGIITPVIVRPRKEGYYEIISGHRRIFAAEKLGYRNLILSGDDRMRYEMDAYSEQISENIELDILRERHPYDQDLLEGIFDLILETVLCKNESIVVASNKYPAELVRSKFLKLNSSHVEYAIDCFKGNTTKVRNIKKYLLTTLFNAPSTISGYYQAAVNHDYPQYAVVDK